MQTVVQSFLLPLAHRLAANLSGRRLSVLIFHRVLPREDALFPEEMHAARFDRLLSFLKHHWNVMPLGRAIQCLKSAKLPSASLSITFDDGYSDNSTVALPILKRHGMSATFFVATGFLDGGRMWNDTVIESVRRARSPTLDFDDLGLGRYALDAPGSRRRAIDSLLGELKYRPVEERGRLTEAIAARVDIALPDDLMLTTGQVRGLRDAGMEIGAHTVNHPILSKLPAEVARREIADSKACLEAILHDRVSLFAYPNGKPDQDYLPEHVQLVKEAGFDVAVSTRWGACDRHVDAYQVPRFTPWNEGHTAFAAALTRNLLRRPGVQPLGGKAVVGSMP